MMLQLPCPTWKFGHYFNEPFVFSTSAFAVRVFAGEEFFQPSSTHSCECSRAPGVPESPGVLLPGDSALACTIDGPRWLTHDFSLDARVQNKKKKKKNNNKRRLTCECPFFASLFRLNPRGKSMAALVRATHWRKQRRLRREQQSIAAVLATVSHHSYPKVDTANDAPRDRRLAPALGWDLPSTMGSRRTMAGPRQGRGRLPCWCSGPQGKVERHGGNGYELVVALGGSCAADGGPVSGRLPVL